MRISLLAALFLGVFGLAAFGLFSLNVFRPVENRFAGSCQPVLGVVGPEDFALASNLGRAFVSSLNRREGPDARGAILSIAPDDPLDSGGWRDRTNGVPAKFRPAGLSYFESGNVRRLFVVNRATRSIEIYDVERNGDLTHFKSFNERRLTNPVDVVAVGPDSFYISNNESSGGVIATLYEFATRAASGTVYYFDGQTTRVVADGLRFANGLAVNVDGSRFYVAETSGRALKIFNRDAVSGALTYAHTEAMGNAVDKITVAADGALWIGAHPKPIALAQARSKIDGASPSLVIRFVDMPGAESAYSAVYSNDGEEISTASVAAMVGRRLLIGSLLDNKYLVCQLGG